MFKKNRWNLPIAFVLLGIQSLGVVAILQEFHWYYLPIMGVVYVWLGFGTTFYLHRLLCHRSFETQGWIKFFFAIGSAIGLAGNPSAWVGTHRYHHLKSDTKDDPHSPLEGLPYAHLVWLFKRPKAFEEYSLKWAGDTRRHWYVRCMERTWLYLLPHLAVAAGLWAAFGVCGMLWCLYFPMLLIYNFTWAVNSICHWPKAGYRSHETSDRSRNVLWVGLASFGEGFHNNHHANPRCAAHGRRWYEIDFTRYLIWTLERVGLVWNVVWESENRETSATPEPEKLPTPAPVAAGASA